MSSSSSKSSTSSTNWPISPALLLVSAVDDIEDSSVEEKNLEQLEQEMIEELTAPYQDEMFKACDELLKFISNAFEGENDLLCITMHSSSIIQQYRRLAPARYLTYLTPDDVSEEFKPLKYPEAVDHGISLDNSRLREELLTLLLAHQVVSDDLFLEVNFYYLIPLTLEENKTSIQIDTFNRPTMKYFVNKMSDKQTGQEIPVTFQTTTYLSPFVKSLVSVNRFQLLPTTTYR
jgi:hypothetical protein